MSSDPSRPKPPPTTNPTPPLPPPPAAKPPPQPAPAAPHPVPPTSAVKLPTQPTPRPYRPKSDPNKKRIPPIPPTHHRRSCCSCCCCLLWFIIILIILTLTIAAAFGVFWILYRPQRPKFTVASLKLSALNLTGNLDTDASGHLITAGNLTVSAKNPNHKISAIYDEFQVSVYSPGNVLIANSSFHPYSAPPGNSTVMRFAFRNSRVLDLDSARVLRSDLGKANNNRVGSGQQGVLGVRLEMETRMGVKIGKKRTGKIGIRVTCRDVRVGIPKNEVKKKEKKSKETETGAYSPSAAVVMKAVVAEADEGKCVVDLSIKIWGFTFGLF